MSELTKEQLREVQSLIARWFQLDWDLERISGVTISVPLSNLLYNEFPKSLTADSQTELQHRMAHTMQNYFRQKQEDVEAALSHFDIRLADAEPEARP